MNRDPSLTALLFPGQGSQTAGMRELVESHRPDLLELVIAELDADPFERIDDGTRFVQPAIYCASLAAWERSGRPDADVLAGHSLGELTALAAAGALDHADGLRVTIERGRLMQEVAERNPGGGMLALLGDGEAARAIADGHGLPLANDNGPTQIVVSGPAEALEAATAEARERELRAIRLAVAGAFHSPEMEEALAPFRAALEAVPVAEPRRPVFCCTSAAPFERIREQLADALVRSVRWRETLLELQARGVGSFIEVGPGKALTGMVRRALDDVEARTLEQMEAVSA
jgi:[acyl-carrier-protein] S-malonyltransferase